MALSFFMIWHSRFESFNSTLGPSVMKLVLTQSNFNFISEFVSLNKLSLILQCQASSFGSYKISNQTICLCDTTIFYNLLANLIFDWIHLSYGTYFLFLFFKGCHPLGMDLKYICIICITYFHFISHV